MHVQTTYAYAHGAVDLAHINILAGRTRPRQLFYADAIRFTTAIANVPCSMNVDDGVHRRVTIAHAQ